MKSKITIVAFLVLGLNLSTTAQTISKDELIFLTSEWKGDIA